jgi:hypothetical protein
MSLILLLLCIAGLGFALCVGAVVLPDRRPARSAHVPQHAALPRRPVLSHARTAAPTADAESPLRRHPRAEHHEWRPRHDLATLARVRAGILALPAEPEMPAPEPEWSVSAWTKAMAEDMNRWLDENVRSVQVTP